MLPINLKPTLKLHEKGVHEESFQGISVNLERIRTPSCDDL